jgi:hypothetical protein
MSGTMQVHPIAALFPMMTEDELAELADDILSNGLIHPIVVDGDGVLIDGRNRLRACEIAGVEPKFQQLNGHDAAAFIVSVNLERRNLSKGQQAIALAMIYPEPQRGRGKKDEARKVLETRSFSRQRLEQARLVLRHSRALAEDVIANRTSLDKALTTMEQERRASQSVDEKMAELRSDAPDIADMVDDERLSLEAGITELRTRQRRTEEAIDAAKRAIARIADVPVQWAMVEKGVALAGADLLCDLDIESITAAMSRLTEIIRGKA